MLEPFYKLVSAVVSEEKNELKPLLKQQGVFLTKKEFGLDIRPLLRFVLGKLF